MFGLFFDEVPPDCYCLPTYWPIFSRRFVMVAWKHLRFREFGCEKIEQWKKKQPVRWFKPWPFHPQTLEVTNNHLNRSLNHPEKGHNRIIARRLVWLYRGLYYPCYLRIITTQWFFSDSEARNSSRNQLRQSIIFSCVSFTKCVVFLISQYSQPWCLVLFSGEKNFNK